MNLILERSLDHNLYATRALLEVCRPLSTEQFRQRFDIGPGSLHDTLRHVIGAMMRWSDRIMGSEIRPSIEKNPQPRSVDELLILLEQGDRDLRTAAMDSETKLDQKISVRFTLDYPVMHITRATALVHICTHGVHHRAQALNMLRRLGVKELPDLDALATEWKP